MLEKIIKQASNELLSIEKVRDLAYSKARNARKLSKQAILSIHAKKTKKAEENISKSRDLIKSIDDYINKHSEIAFFDAVKASKQEFVEANILYFLNTRNRYPTPEELGVANTDYIMGVADVPGELRRQVLDHLKSGDLESAEKKFEKMEEIYIHLTIVEEVSILLKGLRRKLDIIRTVNERTRAEITTESSRERLRKQLAEVNEKLK
jgi:translin